MFGQKDREIDFLRLRVTEIENKVNQSRKVTSSERCLAGSQSAPQLHKKISTARSDHDENKPENVTRRKCKSQPVQVNTQVLNGDQNVAESSVDQRKPIAPGLLQIACSPSKRGRCYDGSYSEGNSPIDVLQGEPKSNFDHRSLIQTQRLRRAASERRNIGQELGNNEILVYQFATVKDKPKHQDFGADLLQPTRESGTSWKCLQPPIREEDVDEEQTIPSSILLRRTSATSVNGTKPTQLITLTKRDGRLSQHKSMQKFGMHPTEMVSKLKTDGIVTDMEARIILLLVESDNNEMLNALFKIEQQGLIKSSIDEFRADFSVVLSKNVTMIQEEERRRSQVNTDIRSHPNYRRASTCIRGLQKVAQRLNQLIDSPRPKLLLVGSGAYNPIHKLHLRMFYVARRYLEEKTDAEVVAGFVSPSHPTLVRQKYRTRPREIIPPRHRLELTRIAVGDSSWLTVDPWEISRRRIMDYVSLLTHTQNMMRQQFPYLEATNQPIQILYLCKGDSILKVNPELLREKGYGCVCVCPPWRLTSSCQQWAKNSLGSLILWKTELFSAIS